MYQVDIVNPFLFWLLRLNEETKKLSGQEDRELKLRNGGVEQLHHQLPHKLVRVVIRPQQEQRLLKLLDVEFEEMESLPESEPVSGEGSTRV